MTSVGIGLKNPNEGFGVCNSRNQYCLCDNKYPCFTKYITSTGILSGLSRLQVFYVLHDTCIYIYTFKISIRASKTSRCNNFREFNNTIFKPNLH